MIDGEVFEQVLEYAEKKLIIKFGTITLLLDQWKVTHKLNATLYEFRVLPGFDQVSFPFLFARSRDTIELFNTNEIRLEEVVKNAPVKCQTRNSFIMIMKDGYLKLHFTSRVPHTTNMQID